MKPVLIAIAALTLVAACNRNEASDVAEAPQAQPQADSQVTPADQAAMERTGAYKGLFFVLMGKLSPLDGVGPRDINLQKLFDRIAAPAAPGEPEVREVILATNFTAEGETTAHVISEALKSRNVQVTRLARGVPVGSELEYVDLGTIAHALADRR